MAYQFTPDLETKNQLIDKEHKQLIEAINSLLEACAAGKGRASVSDTAKFLYEYTAKHFSDEEKLQIEYGYPDFANHKRYHEEFKRVVAGIMKKLEKDGPTIAIVGEINNALAGWLINHIKKEDKKLANFIREKK